MTDEEYRQIARITAIGKEQYIRSYSRFTYGDTTKRSLWLTLNGLVETADMIR